MSKVKGISTGKKDVCLLVTINHSSSLKGELWLVRLGKAVRLREGGDRYSYLETPFSKFLKFNGYGGRG